MENHKSPGVAFWSSAIAAALLGAYLAGYVVLRWQHVLVRQRFGEYVDARDDCLYGTSMVGSGAGYGEDRAERIRALMTGPASILYGPLCLAETEIRNRWFRKVNVER